MMAAGLWSDRRHKLPSPHQPRRRRDCLGELVHIDGFEHAWFEDRADKCTLLAFVDDATNRDPPFDFSNKRMTAFLANAVRPRVLFLVLSMTGTKRWSSETPAPPAKPDGSTQTGVRP